jgi:2TM domain
MTIQSDDQLRDFAIARLRKKRELQAHLIAYVTVNLFLIGIWYASTPDGFFWPMLPLLGWGIGLIFHVWDVVSPEAFSEDRIQREMQRVAGKR